MLAWGRDEERRSGRGHEIPTKDAYHGASPSTGSGNSGSRNRWAKRGPPPPEANVGRGCHWKATGFRNTVRPVRCSGASAPRRSSRRDVTRDTGHTSGQLRRAANTPRTAITTPSAIFAAAAAARPTTAPHPARTAVSGARDSEYSNRAAPTNDPRNAPITLPTIGTGTPITAPTIPPTSAPHADRREPPNVLANRNPRHASMISPRKARPKTTAMVATPTERQPVSQP